MESYKPNRKIPCVYMRGGTSKALFFHDRDLPQDMEARDKVILSAFGSPDRRQIDGMGGANTSTSKVAVIKKSDRPGIDVDYDFGQVDVFAPIVGKTMNCGNISSAVGPFAIDEGLVEAVEPMTEVHIFNTNTQKEIIAQVPVKDGRAVTEGDFSIDGVPGTAAKVLLKFVSPQGAASGKLLPTGQPKNIIEIESKEYEYSFVDAANPVIFVHPEDFGVTGTETPAQFNALPDCEEICRKLEIIRGTGAILLGFAKDLEDARVNSQTLPKIAFATKPTDYTAGSGKAIGAEQIDLVGRLFSVNMKMIDAYMGTGAICTVTAANTPGTIVNEIVCGGGKHPDDHAPHVRIGHPWGIMDVYADLQDNEDGTHTVLSGNLERTARRIMEGSVYVRD
ncbi:PrpF domain-containing protein [Pseudoflavonifractor sp. 60]|uniref:2-methylaconitate cis-trans isomerase PrpF family protein n=1 Tax=Pseudoflavonifractor sp. 60 TaxID=2304576 RepID=UPI001FAE7162|nr:PrpF domain-containing protein [Pseudoflavonifractor sp. 60]